MRSPINLALLIIPVLFSQCGINRQVQQAKGLSKSRYAVRSADSITIAGYAIQAFRDIRQLDDVNPLKYPAVAAGLLRKDIPFKANINLEIVNPTSDTAAINRFEYRLLVAGNELATGTVERRVVVPPGGGKSLVAIPVNANAYGLIANSGTRKAFIDLIGHLAGSKQTEPSRITLKIRPTLMLGNKSVQYPGFIDIDKEVTRDLLLAPRTPNP